MIRYYFGSGRRSLWLVSCLMLTLTASAFTQVKIDPNLPAGSQPLVKRRILFMPDYESVQPSSVSYRSVAPLSVRQKFQIFAGQTLDSSFIAVSAALAGIEQSGDISPNYGQGGGAYAQRFGAMGAAVGFGTFLSEAALPSLFRQDPRYFRKGTGSFLARVWYAMSREAVTQSDRGNGAFNISQLGGLATSIAISTAYYPPVNRTASQNVLRFGIGAAVSTVLNIAREFRHSD
jgi:hypothetical protein